MHCYPQVLNVRNQAEPLSLAVHTLHACYVSQIVGIQAELR